MREIDLLPDWYKRGKKNREFRRLEYIALGAVFCLLLVWSLVSEATVMKAKAELAKVEVLSSNIEQISLDYANQKQSVENLREKAELLNMLGLKIDIDAIIGEVSFLTREGIVLKEMSCVSEVIDFSEKSEKVGFKLKAVNAGSGRGEKWIDSIRYKLVMTGFASEPGKVAELICNLEDSDYFRHVSPSYSRNSSLEMGSEGEEKRSVSEFQISCYIANYREMEGK